MSRPALVLVGVPGSGKSTVAARLAAEWGIDRVEVDELVEARLGATREEYFVSAGEAAYRKVEEPVSLEALATPGVVALSSGAVDAERVREALRSLPVAWLRTSVTAATRRLGMNALGMAPLAAIRDRLGALLHQRAPWYESVADLIVDTDRLTAEEVANEVLRWRSLG